MILDVYYFKHLKKTQYNEKSTILKTGGEIYYLSENIQGPSSKQNRNMKIKTLSRWYRKKLNEN